MHRWLSSTWKRYLFALTIAVLATLVSVALQQFTKGRIVIMPYFPAVILVALYAGAAPAGLCALLAIGATMIFWSFSIGPPSVYTPIDIAVLIMFAITSALMIATAERVRRADARFRLMADTAPVLIWMRDKSKNSVWFNHPWLTFRGRTLQQEINNGWLDGIHPDDLPAYIEHYETYTSREESFAISYRLRRHDGEYRWIFDQGVPLYEGTGNTFSGYIGSCMDITENRRAEEHKTALLEMEREARREAERVGRMKDEFLATLSHELRTPMNAIVGWTYVLRQENLPPQAERGRQVIERNARLQTQIIDDLLDMSRIISGKAKLNVKTVDIHTVINSAIASIQPAADAKHITLTAALTADPAMVAGDAGRLQQVLWNLLSNAVKFTQEGGSIEIGLKAGEQDLELSVSDNGIGIKSEFLPFVFDRFRQADASSTRETQGLGIGLSICKELVEMHGGTIRAFSDGAGKGTRFTVRLPSAARPAAEIASGMAQPNPLEAAAPSLAGLSILVVEDQEDTRELIAMHLQTAGARALLASSVREAIAIFDSQRIDILVSDIGMPNEDGYALIRELRARPLQQGGAVPALALTAFARAEDRRRAILSGYQMHMAKPVDPLELLTMVGSLAKQTNRADAAVS